MHVFSVHLCIELTIIDDADHNAVPRDVLLPNRHDIKVQATGPVGRLRKLNTQTNTHTHTHTCYYAKTHCLMNIRHYTTAHIS